MSKLANKPSKLIKQALKCLKECIDDPRYRIAFNVYHRPVSFPQFSDIPQTMVCFAGGVMAKRLGAKLSKFYLPDDFKESDKLYALDEFRTGNLIEALNHLSIKIPSSLPSKTVVDQNNYKQFVKDMKKIIKELKKYDL